MAHNHKVAGSNPAPATKSSFEVHEGPGKLTSSRAMHEMDRQIGYVRTVETVEEEACWKKVAG